MSNSDMEVDTPSQGRKRKSPDNNQSQPKRPKQESPSSGNEETTVEGRREVAGKILRVSLRNFMCHENLEVNLNENVNFIIGANGSGKSAILAALTVGLGARAGVTGRGVSVRDFIRKGQNSATVEIKITNRGPMKYQYDTYGDSITITRSIGLNNSTYKIKNWRGDVVTSRKDELESIIQCLNIQVDNPISVLNQETAKTFLVTNSKTDMYRFFMKATRLEYIGDNYKSAQEQCEETKREIEETEAIIKDQQKEINALKKKINILNSLESEKGRLNELENEFKWAQVITEERKLLNVDNQVSSQQEIIDNLVNAEQNRALRCQELDNQIELQEKELAEIKKEAAESTGKIDTAKQIFAESKKELEAKKDILRNLHSNLRRKEKEVLVYQEHIKAEEQKAREAGDKRSEALEALAKHEQELDEVEASLRTKQTDSMHFEEDRRRNAQDENRCKIEYEEIRRKIDKKHRELNGLKMQSNDQLTVYGYNMPKLVRRIQEEFQRGKFRKMPRGPMGSYIKMKDPSWIPAVESLLGGNLFAFCVDNTKDAFVLNILIKEVFRDSHQPQVIISQFFDQMHDVSRNSTRSSRYQNALEAMEISDSVVANALIDGSSLETVLLIPSSAEACKVLDDERNVPANCHRATTKNGELFYPAPNYRSYYGHVKRPKYLQVSTAEAIQQLEEELVVLQQELEVQRQKYDEAKKKTLKSNQDVNEANRWVNKLENAQRKLKEKIDQLKELTENKGNQSVNMFITELEELKAKISDEKAQQNRIADEVRAQTKITDNHYNEIKRLKNLSTNVEAQTNPIKDAIKELTDEKRRLNVSLKGSTRRIEEAKVKLQEMKGHQEQQKRVVDRLMEIAEQICPRIDTEKSADEIKMAIREIKSNIENIQRQNGDLEVLIQELEDKEMKQNESKKNLGNLEKSVEKQRKRLKLRRDLFSDMKKEIGDRIQSSFKEILRLRNFRGKLKIDHNAKTLDLDVNPRNETVRSTQDAKCLSGGERSYSTVAFILALWDCTQLPFYFLDEFDVFMDKINRRVIMDILIDHAKTHEDSQFAFLTPLDTSNVSGDKDITVHRLEQPERS